MAEKIVQLRGRHPKTVVVGEQRVTLARCSYGRIRVTWGDAESPAPSQTELVIDDLGLAYEEMTNAELEALLIGMGIDPPARARKSTLLELLHGDQGEEE